MQRIQIPFADQLLALELPAGTEVLSMAEVQPLPDPAAAIERALDEPIDAPPLDELARRRLQANPGARAVVVISDNTRPVPYRGEEGILWPVLRRLLAAGFPPASILVLVATGTHRPLTEAELRRLLDPRVFEQGIPILNHEANDRAELEHLGRTSQGEEIFINRRYLEADLRILTGLVESHFLAGVSGGRKSICPGLIGEESTYRFHSAQMLDNPAARDLNLDGNPCHEQALEVARLAGADFIVNATLDKRFRLTGVFAGSLERAHRAAFEHLRGYVTIPVRTPYDLVITHAGFVGINHYQSVKAALAALPAVRPGGTLLVLAANTDVDPVGSPRYRSVLGLLALLGAERFRRLIFSPDWTFIPEQWEVQAWARVLQALGPRGLVYYSPQLRATDAAIIPGVDGNRFLPEGSRYRSETGNVARVLQGVLAERGDGARMAFLADGPYGILAAGA
jgi:nickel-dependent lactate racemase